MYVFHLFLFILHDFQVRDRIGQDQTRQDIVEPRHGYDIDIDTASIRNWAKNHSTVTMLADFVNKNQVRPGTRHLWVLSGRRCAARLHNVSMARGVIGKLGIVVKSSA